MGKGDRRRGKAKLPELAPIVAAKAHPRDRRGTARATQEDAARVALTARCIHYGLDPTQDNRRAMSAPWLGDPLFMVAKHQINDPAALPALWPVWQAWCSAERTYSVRILGTTGSAKGASIAVLPERFETDQSHTIDTRSHEQKNDDAVRGWMAWRGYLGTLSAQQSTALHSARRGDGQPLWKDHAPTVHGLFALAALRALMKAAERY